MLQASETKEKKHHLTLLKTATLDVSGMKCAGCVQAVERQLCQNTGVISACVNLITEVAVIQYQDGAIEPETLAATLTQRGFTSQIRSSDESKSTKASLNAIERRKKAQKQQLWRLLSAVVLLVFSSIGHLDHIGGPSIPILSNIWFHFSLATLALSIPGLPILVDGWRGLWQLMPNMNSLVGLGTLSTYVSSCVALFFPQTGWECFFDEPVMLLGFILLGRTLEAQARNRATVAIEKLLSLQPQTACLIGNTSEAIGIDIPVEQLRRGELVRVLPGEKIPVDGEVVLGKTSIDESMLTGESSPVAKEIGNNVAAGTINQSGTIVVKVTRTLGDTTLSQIIDLVEEAQIRKAPVQKLVDTVAGYFAYGVMAIAALTFVFWYAIGSKIWPQVLMITSHHLGHDLSASTSPLLLSIKLAIAVLVVSCPCALGLATPTAILVGTSIGAETGILIKGGDILEKVHQLDTIVFDKTGTLTVGKPEVTDCLPTIEITADRLLQLAATVENGTNHPLATAIVNAAITKEIDILDAEEFYTELGLGVSALISGERIYLGNAEWLAQNGIVIDATLLTQGQNLAATAKTVVYLAIDKQIAGIIAIQDRLRPDAQRTIAKLQQLGLQVVLLTGDRAEIANAIAKQLNISQVFAAVKPDRKATMIRSLQQGKNYNLETPSNSIQKQHSQTRIVAMVGDGINDAPALAQADIGISLHGGTDVAIETADIILMKANLIDTVNSIQLSWATVNKIRQNLFWALAYNFIAIPIAAGIMLPKFGFLLNPAVAAAFMAFSSIFVVSNSLLLHFSVKQE